MKEEITHPQLVEIIGMVAVSSFRCLWDIYKCPTLGIGGSTEEIWHWHSSVQWGHRCEEITGG